MINKNVLYSCIKNKGFEVVSFVSKGGYGSIYHIKNKDKSFMAKVQVENNTKSNEIQIKNECFISKSFKGKNIVSTFSIYKDSIKNNSKTKTIYLIVMEKALYMDLKFFLRYLLKDNLMKLNIFNKYFPWIYYISPLTSTLFIYQIIEAFKILFECNYVHRDIKPENLLVTYQFIIKLCDFGIVSKAKDNFQIHNSTWCYEGPEYYQEKDKKIIEKKEDCFKIDYYPLGLTMFYMFFRENLIDRNLKEEIYMKKDIQKLYKILDESVNKIKKHILNEGDEIQNFKNGIKNEDNDIKFIQKGLGELAINLIEKEVKKRPNIYKLVDNEILNQNKKKLKKIYEINQFLEMKLFVELQKPSLLKRNKIKYLFST
jgi:serine/threonine protein kinase